MKITKLRFIGYTTVDLPIIGALPSDYYITKDVDGLGPTEVDVSIADTPFMGGVFQGRRPQNREIVAKVGLNSPHIVGYTPEDLRDELYGMMTPGPSGSMQIQAMSGENVVGVTDGHVKKIEPSLFSKEPEVQLTIACLSPYFRSMDYTFVTGLNKASPQITNLGSAETGFRMNVELTQNMGNWAIAKAPHGERMDLSWPFLAGDILTLDTRPGSRGVSFTRAGTTYSLLHALSTNSEWISLYRGLNTFYTSSESFNWGEVYYRPEYLGV